MQETANSSHIVHFGAFEVDLHAGELRKSGLKIKLQEQPFQILTMLLSRPGDVVTREELQKALWPADTFVDFDRGLNKAINKIREALEDSADNPRFVETLPRRGYRFIAPVDERAVVVPGGQERQPAVAGEAAVDDTGAVREPPPRRAWRLRLAGLLAVLVAGVAAGLLVWHRGWRQPDQVASQRIESLAVLPLENLSADKEQDYFAEGMTDELITDLGGISTLRVISRRSVMRYKSTTKSIPEIARELSVDAVVEGTVLRSGDRVRITAQLIQATPETHLWAEKYERDLRDIMGLQDEVAQQITNHIQTSRISQEHTRSERVPPVNPEAYEAYLKGRHYNDSWSGVGNRLAALYFQLAVEKDPSYAPAYSGLADTYALLSFFGYEPQESTYVKWKAAATKAIEVDNTSAEAHTSIGALKVYHDRDWAGSSMEYQRAIELNPSYESAHMYYSDLLVAMGQLKEATAEAQQGEELDPLSPFANTWLGMISFLSRDYKMANECFRRAIDLDARYAEAYAELGDTDIQEGLYREGEAEIQKALNGSEKDSRYLAYLGRAYAASGKRVEALSVLRELKGLKNAPHSYAIALIYAALGEKDQTFQWLQRSTEDRPSDVMYLKVDPRLDSIRSDSRFPELVRSIGLLP